MERHASTWVVAFGLVGCEPPGLDVRYATEEAEIGTAFEEPLCAGDLRFIDEHVAFLEHSLSTGELGRIRIDVYEERPLPGCGERAGGCVRDGVVRTEWASLGHELVHAVANRLGRPDDFWREGLAVAYGETFVAHGEAGVAESVDLDTNDLDYATAGHFTRWLIDARGLGTFLQAYAAGDFPPPSMGADYTARAPWGYARIHPCPYPELSFVDGVVEASIPATCDHPHTTRFGGPVLDMVTAQRTIVVPEEGTYWLEVHGGAGVELVGCRTEPVWQEPRSGARGDVWDESHADPRPLVWEAPGLYELHLEEAKYTLNLMGDPGTDATLVAFSLRRVD